MTIREILVALGFKVDEDSKGKAEKSVEDLKNFASKILGTIAVVFSVQKLSAFAQDCVQAASDVEEMENKFDVVFDDIRDEVDQWAEDFANAVGRNKNTIKTYLADQQNLLVGFGMTREEGAKLAEDMTSLALDLASFANTDETMSVNNMTKAVMGETEAARALGAVLNDTTRAETMAAMGLSGKYDKLSQLQKMQVNYNAILRQSPDAVGDCIRSSNSYEAAQRKLNSSIAYFKESIGKQLIPIYKTVTNWMNAGVKAATKFAQAILGTTEENNHLLHVFERVQAVIKRLQPAAERFAKGVKTGATEIAKRVKAVWENLKKIFSGVWKTIVSILSPIGKFVKELFTDIFGPEIFAGLGEGIAGVIEFLERLTTAIAESEGAQQVIGGAIVGLIGLMTTLKVILPLVGLVKGSFGGLFNAVSMFKELFGVSFGGVALILGGAVTAVVNFVSMFRNGFNVVKEILMVLGIALAAVGAVILGAPATIAAVVAGIIAAVATLAVVVKEHWESIAAFFGKIGDGIKWVGDKVAQFLHLKPASEEEDKPKARPKSDSGKRFSEALDNAGYSMDAMQSRFEALGVSAEAFYSALDKADGNADAFADALYEACDAGASFEDVQNALGVDLEELGRIMASASEFSAEKFPAALESAGYSVDDMRTRLESLGVSAEEFQAALNASNGNTGLFADALYQACDAGTAFEDVQTALGVGLDELGQIMGAASVITEERFAQAMENAGYSADEMRGRLAELGLSSENFRDILSYSHGDADTFADALYEMRRGGVTFAEVEKALGVSLEELGQIMDSAAPDAESFTECAAQTHEAVDGIAADMTQLSEDAATAVSGVGEQMEGPFAGAFANAGETVRGEIAETKNALTSAVDEETSVLQSLPAQSSKWGSDFMGGFQGGILAKAGAVIASVREVAGNIRSYLHFSAPDVGPLADYETWMPDFISGLASGVQQSSGNLLSAINALGTRIRASVRDALNAVSSDSAGILGRLPSQAFQWGADFIGGLRNGIMSGVSAISNAVRNVAENIRSYLHFSAPDVGPLKDYESWMPDFTAGLARGFESGEDNILEKVRALASGISALTQSATVKATTAAATMVSNRTSNVTQNVNIDNTYNGAATDGARNVTKAMRKSAYDATAYLARGLAMGR